MAIRIETKFRIATGALFLVTVALRYCSGQDQTSNASLCVKAKTCAECIQTDPQCVWCIHHEFYGHRCDTIDNLASAGCRGGHGPPATNVEIRKNLPLTGNFDFSPGELVQIQPQEVNLRLRKGATATLELSARHAEFPPLDFYYLMDASTSFEDDLVNLKTMSDEIGDTLRGLSSDVRIGFGSFVDKVVSPFVDLTADGKAIPFRGYSNPYEFTNHLPLTNNLTLLKTTIDATEISRNLDSPEGGLEALMQVAVCRDVIGWRDEARHVIFFATDHTFHTGGDGRIAGIITPNDGQCHVDSESGNYTVEKIMDYPSPGHLSEKLQDQNILVLFAVPSSESPTYEKLQQFFPGSILANLAYDSSNVVILIGELYNLISSNVELKVRADDALRFDFTAYCENGVPTPNATSCSGLASGEAAHFRVAVTAEGCVEGGRTSFTVSPVGVAEAMTVNVEILCSCDCEEDAVVDSPLCNGKGTYECGQCTCNPGRYGRLCQYGGNFRPCMAPNSKIVCSGRGRCINEECVCNEPKKNSHRVYGTFCQCDNFNCPYFEGQICGGAEHGQCECDGDYDLQSGCVCTSNYTGDTCGCLNAPERCLSPNGLVCNGHGKCECGVCKCDADSRFSGPTCSDCGVCKGQCGVYQECVQCKIFNEGPLKERECNMCNVRMVIVSELPAVKYGYNCTISHKGTEETTVFVPHFVRGPNSVPIIYVIKSNPTLSTGSRKMGIGGFLVIIFVICLIAVLAIFALVVIRRCKSTESRADDQTNTALGMVTMPAPAEPSAPELQDLSHDPVLPSGMSDEHEMDAFIQERKE